MWVSSDFLSSSASHLYHKDDGTSLGNGDGVVVGCVVGHSIHLSFLYSIPLRRPEARRIADNNGYNLLPQVSIRLTWSRAVMYSPRQQMRSSSTRLRRLTKGVLSKWAARAKAVRSMRGLSVEIAFNESLDQSHRTEEKSRSVSRICVIISLAIVRLAKVMSVSLYFSPCLNTGSNVFAEE